jgi:hypothetical protein
MQRFFMLVGLNESIARSAARSSLTNFSSPLQTFFSMPKDGSRPLLRGQSVSYESPIFEYWPRIEQFYLHIEHTGARPAKASECVHINNARPRRLNPLLNGASQTD